MLNKKKTYEEVYGAPGISYHQDGKFYNGAGEEVRVEQVEVGIEDGKSEKQDIGVRIEQTEPKKQEPVVETVSQEQSAEIPRFEKPRPKKYVNVMGIDDCKMELDAAGIEWKPAIEALKSEYENRTDGRKPPIRKALRDMVKELRNLK